MNDYEQPTTIIPSAYRSWEKYLPSPKIRRVIFILIIVLGIYLAWEPMKVLVYMIKKSDTVNSLVARTTNTEVAQITTPLSIDKDSDGDGLADWQETLIGTDPFIYNEPSEIPEGIRDLVTKNTESIVTTDDKLALNIYQRLLSDPVGENINEAVQAATTKEILDLADSIDQQSGTYSYNDLDIIDNSDAAFKSYQNTITALYNSLGLKEDTIQEIYKTFFTGKKNVNLVTFQMKLNQSTTRMIQTPVPMTFANLHLNLVNGLSRANKILGSNQINPNDSSLLYASFIAFQKNLNVVNQTVESINLLNR